MNYVETAENVGFDSIFVSDHGHLPYEALTTLAAVAMRTKTLKIGTAVIDPNRRSPATLAQEIANLDRISGGRLILGLGGGGLSNEPIHGIEVRKKASRSEEIINIIKRFWMEPKVNYQGRFFTYKEAIIVTKPVQKPRPAIWFAGFGPRMKKIAAKNADGYITQYISPKVVKKEFEIVRDEMKKLNKDPENMEYVFCNPTSVSLEYDEARRSIELHARLRLARWAWAPYYAKRLGYEVWKKNEDIPQEAIDDCFVFGTPEDCTSRIKSYIKSGITYYITQNLDLEGLKLFGKKVIPHFREEN